jgi:hypothetical protein
MISRWFSSRVLWAALLALVLAAPQSATPVTGPAVPAWVMQSLCLADPPQPDDHPAPAHPAHEHCTLCVTGLALFTPPQPIGIAAPHARSLATAATPPLIWFQPDTARPYASRAPPPVV